MMLENYLTVADSSDLESLLTAAVTYENTPVPTEKIILFSANDAFIWPINVTLLMEELTPQMSENLTIDILDLQNLDVVTVTEDGVVYEGNNFLYDTLTAHTGGTFRSVRENAAATDEFILTVFPQVEPVGGFMDLSTDMEQGIIFHEQDLFGTEFTGNEPHVFYQTGRYLGDFPMNVEAYLITEENDFFSEEITLDTTGQFAADTFMREMFYGNYLNRQVTNVAEYESIIAQSIEERVLTPLTAFLALEPGMGGTVCIPCIGEGGGGGGVIINNNNVPEEEQEARLLITPNPASTEANIRLNHVSNAAAARVKIYDMQGKLVTDLTDTGTVTETGAAWLWNIDSKVVTGAYLCDVTIGRQNFREKIAVIR